MKIVDKEQWNRKIAYNTFIGYSDPTFSITTRLDVTQLYNRCKNEGASFFTDFLYVVMRCLNGIDEFKTRIKGDDVILYDSIDPSFIIMKEDDSITDGRIKMTDDYPEFYNRVRNEIETVKEEDSNKDKMNESQTSDVIYISCLPWMDFTSIAHPYDHPDKESSSIPRVTWGMAVENGERRTMAFDISAHHSLMDGYHITKAVRCIQKALDNPTYFDDLI